MNIKQVLIQENGKEVKVTIKKRFNLMLMALLEDFDAHKVQAA